MAEIDVNAYATTAANAAATVPTVVETQQPGGTGALRQVMAIGDPTTRTSIQTVKPASTATVATDLPAVVALHPTSPTPTGTNSIGRAAIDQTTNIIAATTMQNAAVAVGNGVNLNVQGYTTAIISITGTMSAGTTIAFKASPDDVFFDFIAAHQIGVSGNLSNTTTNIGNYRISCAAFKSLQAIITTYGAGTVTVKGTVSVLPGHPTTVNSNIVAALPAGGNTIGTVIIQTAATSIITSATAAITSTTVLAANANRKGAYFYNDSTSVLYLAYAATASNTAYTVQLAANSYYEMPEKPLYTGLMTGIWVAAVGAVRVTELS